MAHYEFNCVDRFYFEVVEHRPMKDKQNEFKTMWAKKTILKTREKYVSNTQFNAQSWLRWVVRVFRGIFITY